MIGKSRSDLDSSISRFLNQQEDFKRKFEILEAEVSVNPDTPVGDYFIDPTDLCFPYCRSLDDKILLGILSWYVPEAVRFQIFLWLDRNWGPEQKEIKEVILVSKVWALAWLQIQKRWNGNDFFGNILSKRSLRRVLESTGHRKVIHKKARIKRYTGWCRGHRDGTAPIHSNTSRVLPGSFEIRTVEELRAEREILFHQRLLALRTEIEHVLFSAS